MTDLSAHTFGAEFEAIFPPSCFSKIEIARRVAQVSGLQVEAGSRTAPTSISATAWKVVDDGSVHGAGIAAELVSPILRGDEGLEQVRKICEAMQTIGATVNQSCGFHVHVGVGRGAELSFFKNLVKLYAKFEPAIDSVMAPSRRGSINTYCRSLAQANIPAVDAAASLPALIEAQTRLPRGTYQERFFKLNLKAFTKHFTVEFRQHSGTTDAIKATNWIKTCIRMVIAAKNGKSGTPRGPLPTTFDHLTDPKAKRTAELICRPQGATRAEIIDGTDWRALSVNRQARLAGISINVVRERGTDRYYAVTEAGSDMPADLGTLVQLIESSSDESAFLTERARALLTSSR